MTLIDYVIRTHGVAESDIRDFVDIDGVATVRLYNGRKIPMPECPFDIPEKRRGLLARLVG